MSRFFSAENPVMTYLTLVRDWIILSFLWCICSLPIITIGTSTAAMYYVALKMAREEGVPITKSFFHAFRDNLKQGIGLTLFFGICACALRIAFAYAFGASGGVGTVLLLGVISFSVCLLCVAVYSFAFMAQFSNTIGGILNSAVYLAGKNLLNTVIILLLNTIPVWVILLSFEAFLRMLPIWIFLMPGMVAYLCSLRLIKLFDPLIAAIKSRESAQKEENVE